MLNIIAIKNIHINYIVISLYNYKLYNISVENLQNTILDNKYIINIHFMWIIKCVSEATPGSGVPTTMDLRYQTSLMDTNACNIVPGAGDLGIGESARLISPGIAAESIIVNRMSRRDFAGMPPLGSNIAHSNGATLITEWINNLDSCN